MTLSKIKNSTILDLFLTMILPITITYVMYSYFCQLLRKITIYNNIFSTVNITSISSLVNLLLSDFSREMPGRR
jgi:hypothetical protein